MKKNFVNENNSFQMVKIKFVDKNHTYRIKIG